MVVNSPDPYFANSLFSPLLPAALLYTTVSNIIAFCLKPIPVLRLTKERLQSKYCFEPKGAQIAIVTGSNTGIGFETASALVERGYDVIMACRSRDKGESAANHINKCATTEKRNSGSETTVCPGKAIFIQPLDLSSFSSIRSFATVFKAQYSALNILVNNAGINTTGKSADGHELCFQTNFLGHFLLTQLLLPELLKAKNFYPGDSEKEEAGRIVNLSSVTHHFARADEVRTQTEVMNQSGRHDEEWWKGCATFGVSENTYKESKLASALFTLELNKRYGKEGLRAMTANPGAV